MNEFSPETIEAEIATLSSMIEEKRRELESLKGISVENENGSSEAMTKETIRNFIERSHGGHDQTDKEPKAKVSGSTPNDVTDVVADDNKSYLDSLTDEIIEVVNQLISLVPTKGIKATLREAKKNDPIVVDAFHDALVEKLYEELKQRNIV